jgi:hypothetical protein
MAKSHRRSKPDWHVASLRDKSAARADLLNDLERKITALRNRSTHEKRSEKERVLRRAVGGLLV